MMKKACNWILLASWAIMLGLSACGSARTEPNPTITASSTATNEPSPLATPYAQSPAAGICASFEGEIVKVTLNPDIPDPRCSKVRANQKLEVANHTQNTLQVSIGSFEASLEPGAEVLFDIPFGDYLETGVHQLQVDPCCGAELWLEANP
jgi:hypothetical protein